MFHHASIFITTHYPSVLLTVLFRTPQFNPHCTLFSSTLTPSFTPLIFIYPQPSLLHVSTLSPYPPSLPYMPPPIIPEVFSPSPSMPPVFSLHGPEFVPGYNGADYRRQRGTAPRLRREPDASSWTLPTRRTACSGRSKTERGNCKQNPSKERLAGRVIHIHT